MNLLFCDGPLNGMRADVGELCCPSWPAAKFSADELRNTIQSPCCDAPGRVTIGTEKYDLAIWPDGEIVAQWVAS